MLVRLLCHHLEEERLNTVPGGADAFRQLSFGALRIDGSTYEQDVVIDRGEIRKREKALSRRFRALSIEEKVRRAGTAATSGVDFTERLQGFEVEGERK